MDGGPGAAPAQSKLSDVEGLRTTAVCRPPQASTGPLERPWCRFAAYGSLGAGRQFQARWRR